MDVRQLAEDIVTREGGFVNDPSDPGGATNHGVTIGTLRALGRDVTHDGRVDIADVHALTIADAVEIFMTQYFGRPGINYLPECLQPSIFDMYVNSGSQAVKLLQHLLVTNGYSNVSQDGKIGPITAAAASEFCDKVGATTTVDEYGAARREFYYQLADARPASRKYACARDGSKGGWILRAETFMSPASHLTDEQHCNRCKAWK